MELIKEIIINEKAISANNTYGLSKESKGERHMFLKPEAQAFRNSVSKAVGFVFEVIDYDVFVEYEFSFRTKHGRDLDNCLKNTQDALTKSGIWTDDVLVRKLSAEKYIGTEDKVVIKIYRY
ncbi:MAG: RusA family crossover junction endodeoxyribonuclease [Fusobacteriaceae bacterium]